MKERPILFSGPMVRALLDGCKTQTRRIMNPQPKWCANWGAAVGMNGAWLIGSPVALGYTNSGDHWQAEFNEDTRSRYCTQEAYGWGAHSGCPYGVVGDRLWVREAWRVSHIHDQIAPKYLRFDRGMTIMYDAGGSRAHDETGQYVNSPDYPPTRPSWAGKGRPSIHMPRAASRITLEVTGVRVERLQDISEADAQAEGAVHGPLLPMGFNWAGCDPDDAAMRSRFAVLWHGINAARGYGWDVNPWVWCIEFRRIA